jgi:SAM-dependent methyltransferase
MVRPVPGTASDPLSDAVFAELLAEGAAAPVEGWDFSWFDGRATEQRPSWGYSGLLAGRMAAARAVLDLQTGGGEVLASGLAETSGRPSLVAATESWPPNLAIARDNLGPLGVEVLDVADAADLPFPDGSFDLVVSRHPVLNRWDEIARVLVSGGTFLSQQVGAGTVGELARALTDPRERADEHSPVDERTPERTASAAEAAGLTVLDLRAEALRMEFFDIAAVVVFLRKVVWTVPGFTVQGYREQLWQVHRRIIDEGCFVAYSQRFLIEASRP